MAAVPGLATAGGMRAVGPTPGVFAPPESARPTVVGERWAVSAGHPLVAHVAALVFEAGGNAVDAGVAGALAATVVQVDMCNLGGVAPVAVRPAGDDVVHTVAGVGTWGSSATVDAFRARFGGDMPLGPGVGVVPAAPSAHIRTLQRFGTWTFADCAAPAIALAAEGFTLDRRLADSLRVTGRTFCQWASSRSVYWAAGRPPLAGDRLVQPALAATLRQLADAERGPDREQALDAAHDAFYRGEIAERIVAFSQAGDGWLEPGDLTGFEAEVEPGVHAAFHGWQVWTPSAWCQGPALLQALSIVAEDDLESLGHGSADYVHLLAEAVRLAFEDRERHYGDPRFVDVPLDDLLSPSHARALRATIDPARVRSGPGAAPGIGARPDTTYLCTIGADGAAYSAMPSDTLDGGPIIPELGIIISPRGVQSRLDREHPAALGPGRRPRLTPAPAIALRDRRDGAPDREVMAFGCPGGDVILQGMLQSFLNVTVFGMTPQQAVEAPRFAAFGPPGSFFPHPAFPRRLALESALADRVGEDLAARGHDVRRWPAFEFDAGACAIAMDGRPPGAHRVLEAAADPRRIGYALAR